MNEFRSKVLAEIDERIAANTGLTRAQMESLKAQIVRIPFEEPKAEEPKAEADPKPKASKRTAQHADMPIGS